LSHSNPTYFNNNINTVFKIWNDWFKKKLLSLNFTKTQFTNFTTKNNNQIEININYNNKFIPTITYTKFLSLTVDCSLTWINHINLLTKKLSTLCYLIQNFKPYLSISTLKIIHHSLFHSIMSYGIMLWGNSWHSSVIFKMQKRVIRILVGYGCREYCRQLFKELKILTLLSQYIFSLLLFVVNNRDYFVSNSVYDNINTRWKNYLHLPYISLAIYQKGVYYSCIKIFTGFPKQLRKSAASSKALSANTFILQFRWIF
jgi:hypothetical protein